MDYRCPVDGTILEAKTSHRGRVYSCPECGGEMVNYAVLRKDPALSSSVKAFWNAAMRKRKKEGKVCPQCNRPMTEVKIQGGETKIDICLPCQLVWFDTEEYGEIPSIRLPEPTYGTYDGLSDTSKLALMQLYIEDNKRKDDTYGGPMPTGWKWVAAMSGLPAEDEGLDIADLPYATWFIAAFCVFVYFMTSSNLNQVIQQYGFCIGHSVWHGIKTLFPSFFIHAGITHLISNVYYLIVFGDNVEDEAGWRHFLSMLFLGHIAGSLLYIAVSANAKPPSVGASAGISALIAYYTVLYPRAFLRFIVLFRGIRIRTYQYMILWLAIQFMMAYKQANGSIGGVNALAHLGGAAVGFIWAFFRRKFSWQKA